MNNYKEVILVTVLFAAMLIMGTGALKYGSPEWQEATCQNNLRQLYKMTSSYQKDNSGLLPPRIDKTRKTRWKYWTEYINKYSSDPMFFYCPASPKAAKMFDSDPLTPKVFSLKSVSYGMNYSLGNYKAYGFHNSKLTKLSQAYNPSYMILLGDSKTQLLRPTKWCWQRDYAPVHSDKSNYLMLDGSVQCLGKGTLGLVTLGSGKDWEGWTIDRKRWSNIK
jgi:prepilin-type processing-associated H-X9-DG protein